MILSRFEQQIQVWLSIKKLFRKPWLYIIVHEKIIRRSINILIKK